MVFTERFLGGVAVNRILKVITLTIHSVYRRRGQSEKVFDRWFAQPQTVLCYCLLGRRIAKDQICS